MVIIFANNHTGIKNRMSEKRISWVDQARGIAILLVVLGHCIGYMDAPGNRWILSFHMPLFFFVSGVCMYIPAKQDIRPGGTGCCSASNCTLTVQYSF